MGGTHLLCRPSWLPGEPLDLDDITLSWQDGAPPGRRGGYADELAAGKVRVACLGLGTDPLSLATDVLTVAAFASDVFDELFGGLVETNEEGRVVSGTGIPFSAEVVDRFTGGGEPMQAAGAAVLELAWRHREQLRLC